MGEGVGAERDRGTAAEKRCQSERIDPLQERRRGKHVCCIAERRSERQGHAERIDGPAPGQRDTIPALVATNAAARRRLQRSRRHAVAPTATSAGYAK